MQWEVTGADRATGEEKQILIEANDEASAKRRANRAGLLVADARPLDPDDSVVGTSIVPVQQVPVYRSAQPPAVQELRMPAYQSSPPAPPPSQQINFQPVIQNHVLVQQVAYVPAPRWSAGVAMLLSFFWPGLGQLYKGQILNGLVWMVVVIGGYICLVIPGLILHLCCIIGAGSGDPRR